MAPPPKVQIVLPTPPDILLMVAENMHTNLLRRQSAEIEMPSLYRRAFQIVNETDEVAVTKTPETR